MASTNKTTNYELSQYIGSDKPSYLNDYNQDMSKIDLGIHAAKSEADTNATAIGTLSSLTTTAKTDLVSAINEVDSEASTANATAVQADGKADTNATAIGTLANLTTTEKGSTVGAINEINGKVGNLSNLTTTEKSSTVGAINEVKATINNFNLTSFTNYGTSGASVNDQNINLQDLSVTVAKNSDGSLAKIYGYAQLHINSGASGSNTYIEISTDLRPDSDIYISCSTLKKCQSESNQFSNLFEGGITITTTGKVRIEINTGYDSNLANMRILLLPCLYFIKDFGDTPTQ